MNMTLERAVECGQRGGEDLVLLLKADFNGSKEELEGLLEDGDKLRKAVAESFDDYRGENGDEVSVCDDEDEVEEAKSSCLDFCFYRRPEGDEFFWVEKTGHYEHQFADKPAEKLFDELTKALKNRQWWSSSLENNGKRWLFSHEHARAGNAE